MLSMVATVAGSISAENSNPSSQGKFTLFKVTGGASWMGSLWEPPKGISKTIWSLARKGIGSRILKWKKETLEKEEVNE